MRADGAAKGWIGAGRTCEKRFTGSDQLGGVLIRADTVAETGPVFAAAERLAGVGIAGNVARLDCAIVVVACRAGEIGAGGGEEQGDGTELDKTSRAVTL